MTYWYETLDDQKDTWHWMGIAMSVAHTIGLHRNWWNDALTPDKKKLWKRTWWSCFMRDRLIALGMRRPTRINDAEFDVPMLVESDFEIQALADSNTIIPPECRLLRDVSMQRELARMCISKAKLCICISQVLKTQYTILTSQRIKPENNTNTTMMMFPNKQLDNMEAVCSIDAELSVWSEQLPTGCQYRPLTRTDLQDGRATIAVQRTILHMMHEATIAALHRPQFLPSWPLQAPTTSWQVQNLSRVKVCEATLKITRIATELHELQLAMFLPTTGVAVLLPAMIIHLLAMKNPSHGARDQAVRGFHQCMLVMEKLRGVYCAADYATGFLDAALRRVAIERHGSDTYMNWWGLNKALPLTLSPQTTPPENMPTALNSETAQADAKVKEETLINLAPNTINAAGLKLDNAPSTPDFSPFGLSLIVSGECEQTLIEAAHVGMGSINNHEAFDWNTAPGIDVVIDNFQQFPAECGELEGDDNLQDIFRSGLGCDWQTMEEFQIDMEASS